MSLNLRDEKKSLLALKRKKEEMKGELVRLVGKGKRLDGLLSSWRKEMIRLKNELKNKYKLKLEHLQLFNYSLIELLNY